MAKKQKELKEIELIPPIRERPHHYFLISRYFLIGQFKLGEGFEIQQQTSKSEDFLEIKLNSNQLEFERSKIQYLIDKIEGRWELWHKEPELSFIARFQNFPMKIRNDTFLFLKDQLLIQDILDLIQDTLEKSSEELKTGWWNQYLNQYEGETISQTKERQKLELEVRIAFYNRIITEIENITKLHPQKERFKLHFIGGGYLTII